MGPNRVLALWNSPIKIVCHWLMSVCRTQHSDSTDIWCDRVDSPLFATFAQNALILVWNLAQNPVKKFQDAKNSLTSFICYLIS